MLGSQTGPSDQYRLASDESRRALLAYPWIKKDVQDTTDRSETFARKTFGLTRDELVYAAYAAPLVTQQITTKPFPTFKYKLGEGYVIRPEATYSFRGDERFNGLILLIKEF